MYNIISFRYTSTLLDTNSNIYSYIAKLWEGHGSPIILVPMPMGFFHHIANYNYQLANHIATVTELVLPSKPLF